MQQGGWNPPPGGPQQPGMPGQQQQGYGQAPGGYPQQQQQQQQQGYGAPPPGMPPGFQGAVPTRDDAKGFFAGLLDFTFTTFITTKVIKFLYGLILLLVGLGVLAGLFGIAMSLINGRVVDALLALVVLPIATVLSVIFGRMYMELIIVIFRIAEDLGGIRKNTAKE